MIGNAAKSNQGLSRSSPKNAATQFATANHERGLRIFAQHLPEAGKPRQIVIGARVHPILLFGQDAAGRKPKPTHCSPQMLLGKQLQARNHRLKGLSHRNHLAKNPHDRPLAARPDHETDFAASPLTAQYRMDAVRPCAAGVGTGT